MSEFMPESSFEQQGDTDLSRQEARFESAEMTAERSAELEDSLTETSHKALNFSDRLRATPDTKVKHSEMNGDVVEVATTPLTNGQSVEHVTTPEGEMTIINLTHEGEREKITINHSTSEILVGDNPVTTPEESAQVSSVIDTLAVESGDDERNVAPAVGEDAPGPEVEDTPAEAAEEVAPAENEATESPEDTTLSPEEEARNNELHGQFAANILGPYMQSLGPAAEGVFQEIGLTLPQAQEMLQHRQLNLGQDTIRAIHELSNNAAKPGSSVWRENPNSPSMLGAAARESRSYLVAMLKSAFNKNMV